MHTCTLTNIHTNMHAYIHAYHIIISLFGLPFHFISFINILTQLYVSFLDICKITEIFVPNPQKHRYIKSSLKTQHVMLTNCKLCHKYGTL